MMPEAAYKDQLEYYRKNKIRVRILDLPTTNIKPMPGQEAMIDLINNLLIEVLSYMAEQERLNIRQRQAEGIAIAKAQGKHKGRQPKKLDKAEFQSLYEQYKIRRLSKRELAEKLHISRTTLDRHLQKRGFRKAGCGASEISHCHFCKRLFLAPS